MAPAKRDKFTSSFPVWMSFIQIALMRSSNIMLNRSGKSNLPCLAPDLIRKAFSFSPLWCLPWACHIMSFITLRCIYKRMLNLSNAFSPSIAMILWFLSFILLMWFIIFIDLCLLNHPYISGINPIWSWYIIFLMWYLVCFVSILLRIFASMFTRDISL